MAIWASRLRRRRPGPATFLAVALIVLSVGFTTIAQRAAERSDEESDRAVAERDVQGLEASLAVLFAETSEVAAHASTGSPAFGAAARRAVARGTVPAIALVATDGSAIAFEGRPPSGLSELTSLPRVLAESLSALAATVSPLAAPVPEGDLLLLLAPVVPGEAPPGLAARRQALTGAVAAAVPVDRLRERLRDGTPVQLRAGDAVIGDTIGDPILVSRIRAGNDVWTLALGPPAGGRPLVGPVVLAITLAGSAALVAAARRQQVRRQEAELVAGGRARQLEMIAGTSASLHRSLDLAEVLPAFCVGVTQEYALDSLAIQLADDDGNLVEAFRYGRPPDPNGNPASFELRRGSRVVGRIDAGAARPVGPVEARSLQALADLLAVAVNNAELYQREQQAVSRLHELDAMRNAFLGTVSHELRTSTTAVQGFAELLAEHWDTFPEERRRELSARIRRQAASLRHLVDDLLDYARLEQQELRIDPREVELGVLARQITESMTPLLSRHELVIDDAPGVWARADPHAVERILANLLSNAAKYAPPATRITVTVRSIGDRARLAVADQGPGIPADERRRVFTRFYRRSNPETLRTRGAGIGLSILSDFAASSDAIVTVTDAPGGGAVLTVDFPAAPAGSEPLAHVQEGSG